jgi:hypothetical protein
MACKNMLGVAWRLLHVVRSGVKMKDNYMNVNSQYEKNWMVVYYNAWKMFFKKLGELDAH